MKVFLDACALLPTISVGTQALIVGSMEITARAFPDAEFIMLSPHIGVEENYCKNEVFKINFINRRASRLATILDFANITKNVDVIISPWGDGYISAPPHKIFQKTFFLSQNRKPMFLFPSSIGPFTMGIKTFIARQGLLKFNSLMARDTITYDYLKQIGLNKVRLLPDTAFALEPVNNARYQEILRAENIPNQECIGLNVSQLMHYKCEAENIYAYPAFIAKIADHLVERFSQKIILIPHQIWPKCCGTVNEKVLNSIDGDDRMPIKEAMKHIRHKTKVFPMLGEYGPREYKSVIGQCSVFIGGRMHSVIAATSQCVPSLLMQYSHKAPGVMQTMGMGDYVWDFRGDRETFFKKVEQLWLNRESIRRNLSECMLTIKEDVWEPGKIMKKVLCEKR